MNILQVHKYYWPRDGASKYMLQLEALLRERGHEMMAFAMQQDQTLGSSFSPYFVSDIDLSHPEGASLKEKISAAGRMLYSREAALKMEQLLDEHPVDVVHLHNIYHHISPSILPVIKKRKIPIVMTLHDYKLLSPNYTMFHHGAVHEENARGWYLSCIGQRCHKDSYAQSALVTAEMIWHHKFLKYYERFVDHFIAPSQFMQDICVRYGWPEEKFSHIVHPYEPAMRAMKTEEKEGDYVAFLGRLSAEKGVETLIRAAAHIPSIPIKIAGEGPELQRLQSLSTSLNLTNIEFVGFLRGDRLHTFLEQARLTVVPSIWYENYPLSILEPKVQGKVIIGSAIGGIPELLPQELLAAPHDENELAKKIEFWYNSSQKERNEKGRQLQQQALTENDPERHVERIERLYQHLMN